MRPDASLHDPAPDYLRSLIARSGLSQRGAARAIGVSERAIRQYLAGRRRLADGRVLPVLAPYPVQFALEALALARRNGVPP